MVKKKLLIFHYFIIIFQIFEESHKLDIPTSWKIISYIDILKYAYILIIQTNPLLLVTSTCNLQIVIGYLQRI